MANNLRKVKGESMHSMNHAPCSACGDMDGCHMPVKLRDNRLSLAEFWDALAEWSQATFGTDVERGPLGPTKHLAKEVLCELLGLDRGHVGGVLEHAKYDPTLFTAEEFADCLFLIFDAARRAGFTFEQLRIAVNEKLKVNRARRWGPKSADGITEHDRAGEVVA